MQRIVLVSLLLAWHQPERESGIPTLPAVVAPPRVAVIPIARHQPLGNVDRLVSNRQRQVSQSLDI